MKAERILRIFHKIVVYLQCITSATVNQNCSFLSNLLKTIYLWNTVEKAKVLAQEMKLPKPLLIYNLLFYTLYYSWTINKAR